MLYIKKVEPIFLHVLYMYISMKKKKKKHTEKKT